jgi:hypothetical protein
MKTKSCVTRPVIAVARGLSGVMVCGLLSMIVLPPAWGQEPKPGDVKSVDVERMRRISKEVEQRRAAVAAAYPEKRYDLEFPGGTPTQLVAAIRKASEGPCNLVIATDAAKLPLPPLSLDSTTTPEVLMALAQTLNNAGTAHLSVQVHGSTVKETTVWTLNRSNRNESPPLLSCQVTNIEFLLAAYTVDEITNALATAWKLQGGEPPKYSYDKATGLLMVAGDGRQLELVNNVLQQMNEGAKKRMRDKSASASTSAPSAPATKSAGTK